MDATIEIVKNLGYPIATGVVLWGSFRWMVAKDQDRLDQTYSDYKDLAKHSIESMERVSSKHDLKLEEVKKKIEESREVLERHDTNIKLLLRNKK